MMKLGHNLVLVRRIVLLDLLDGKEFNYSLLCSGGLS